MQGVPFVWIVAPPFVLTFALAVGCASKDDGITYADDIRPMFAECEFCHSPGAPFGPGHNAGPDVIDPDSPLDGLTVALNNWKVGHPELPVPERVVVPGQPDDSFLINKISDPALDLLAGGEAGGPMPYQVPRITTEELGRIEQWVSSGAQDDAFFRGQVFTIFVGPNSYTPGKCDVCHYQGTPNPPDLTDPFGPEGVVGVTSTFRRDLLRVVPGDSDASLLVQRVRASANSEVPSSEYGAPMPKQVTPLNESQVDRVRQWIAQGARP